MERIYYIIVEHDDNNRTAVLGVLEDEEQAKNACEYLKTTKNQYQDPITGVEYPHWSYQPVKKFAMPPKYLTPEFKEFVEYLIKTYSCVSWGGMNAEHWHHGASEFDIVVYECGIRGPADWFYLNNEGYFAHGGYSGYRAVYTRQSFEEMIKKTEVHNAEYNAAYNAIVDDKSSKVSS